MCALLAILEADDPYRQIVPDYTKSTSEVYIDGAIHLIKDQQKLFILSFCEMHGDASMPTWAPDWSSARLTRSLE